MIVLDTNVVSELTRTTPERAVVRWLDRVSPLAVPVLLEIGREPVYGEAADVFLAEAAEELVKEAMG